MPELCLKLKAATGVVHAVDGDLKDYPVFVATKTGDPERVKVLVAAAMRAQWRKDGDKVKLIPVKPDLAAEYVAFEQRFKAATTNKPHHLQLPIRDFYDMAPGQMIRYSYPPSNTSKPLPASMQKAVMASDDRRGSVIVRREAEGLFECNFRLPGFEAGAFNPQAELELRALPKEVVDLLGSDLDRAALTPKEQQAIQSMVTSPASLKIDWTDLSKRDPIAVIADSVLPKVAAAIKPEMAVALPDLSLFSLGRIGNGSAAVRAALEPLVSVIDWAVIDGALIGKLPMCDRVSSGQVRRDVLERLIGSVKAAGVVNVDALSKYVREQRRAASNCWADVMLLVMAGVIVDQQFIGDYPYNLRLYTSLSQHDWALLRSGTAFGLQQLGAPARESLYELLLQARTRLESSKEDPAYWPGFETGAISLLAAISDESVLIGWTGFAAEVFPLRDSAGMYEMRKKSLGSEPLYQPAVRQKLKLTITPIGSPLMVETGFSEVKPDASLKPSRWDQLPKAMAEEFRKVMEEFRKRGDDQTGPPPPRS
jgi:hypothetical protein